MKNRHVVSCWVLGLVLGAGLLFPSRLLWAADVVAIVTTEDFPPYNYVENGRPVGYSTEVAEALVREVGMSSDVRVVPWARALLLATENPSVLIPLNRTKEREEKFYWVGKILEKKDYLYRLKSRPEVSVKDLEDAKRFVIGGVRGNTAAQYLQKQGFIEGENLDLVPTTEQNYKKLFLGRVDLVPSANEVLVYQFRKLGFNPSDVEKVLVLGEKTELYLALGRHTSEDVVERFREAFVRLEGKKGIDALKAKYSVE